MVQGNAIPFANLQLTQSLLLLIEAVVLGLMQNLNECFGPENYAMISDILTEFLGNQRFKDHPYCFFFWAHVTQL